MYSPSLYIKSNEKGVFFKNPIKGNKVFITPEKDMQIQLDLNSDIAMCLDTMPLIEHSKKQIQLAVKRTNQWAKRCKHHHNLIQEKRKIPKNKMQSEKQLLFGITQGGIHKDLRKISCQQLKEINFDGYSIGGLALGEPRKQMFEMVRIHKSIIPKNKPCYLMGVGNPIELLEAISLGVDMFDSRFPTHNARHGTLFTSQGKLRIFQKQHELSKLPIDKNCNCFVCKYRKYTRAYIRYQLSQGEAVGMRLATYHNLYYLMNLIKQSREAIKKGKFKSFKDKIQRIYEKAERSVKKV